MTKSVSKFHKNRCNKDGYHNWCKICSSRYGKEWRNKNQGKINSDYMKTWRDNNKSNTSMHSKNYAKKNKKKDRLNQKSTIVFL